MENTQLLFEDEAGNTIEVSCYKEKKISINICDTEGDHPIWISKEDAIGLIYALNSEIKKIKN